MFRTQRRWLLVLGALSLLTLAACSSDGADDATDTDGTSTTSTAPAPGGTVERPDGPAATVDRELGDGGGAFLGSAAAGPDLSEAGYVEHEFQLSGTATSFEADGDLAGDGRWTLTAADEAAYTTRIVVRRPAQARNGNGAVALEWLNVSGGIDANPDWAYGSDEIVRSGTTWVGVSVQSIGIEGGPVAVGIAGTESIAGKGLKALDPGRYGELSHPGDQYAYDMYTQVARALRQDDGTLLGGVPVERLLAIGESQSGFALTTYANGFQPQSEMFDGFLIHSRGGAALPLAGVDGSPNIDIAAAISGTPTQVRDDLGVPVIILETESDVVGILNYLPARQPDSDTVRVWEVAGTAHADRALVGAIADGVGCPAPINDGPHHFVVKSALAHLDAWVRDGTVPPSAEPLSVDTSGSEPAYVRDELGIVEGGVRTPVVDVPVDVLSGDSAGGPVFCLLMGTTTPIPEEELAERYGTAEDYLAAFEAATDEAIEAGFVLEADRDAMLATAQPDRIPAG